MQVISVVRNFDMYNRLVRDNPNWKDAVFTAFDNRTENETIPVRYNSFLSSYDYSKPDWFVFCHEDWEIKEDITPKLEILDKNALYGPIGVKKFLMAYSPLVGKIAQSEKDGANIEFLGIHCDKITEVGTFDCQCLIVHSSVIQKYDLRFDEILTWDLYIEDFCICANEKYHIVSKVLQMNCQHYSYGNITDRFYEQYRYLQTKWKRARYFYITTCCQDHIGWTQFPKSSLIRSYLMLRKLLRFFYQTKKTKSGKTIIKICKIPVYNR